MSAWAQTIVLAQKASTVERRAGEAVWVIAPSGAVALFIIPLAVGADIPLLRQLAPAMYWVVVFLFGMLVTVRRSSLETPAQIAMLRLAGVPLGIRMLAEALAATVWLLVLEVLLLPVVIVLYDPQPGGWLWLPPTMIGVAAGLALLGGTSQSLLSSSGLRQTLTPLMSLPLAIPLLLAATQAFEAARLGASPMLWLTLLLAVDLGLVLAALFAGHVMEESS
jgi:heme exporter protein B